MQSMAHHKEPIPYRVINFDFNNVQIGIRYYVNMSRVLCECDMIRKSGQNRTKKIMITHVAYFSQMSTFLDEF